MKKQILLCSAMLMVLQVFPQNSTTKLRPAKALNYRLEKDRAMMLVEGDLSGNKQKLAGPQKNQNESTSDAASPTSVSATGNSINWKLLCGSMNTYGMLVSQSRPLQYNDNVNAVSFVHRKSDTYTATPTNNNSGSIVAEISSDWGNNWDSTCIWASVEGGRYPQGAIYAGIGNSNVANAYIVGCGPTVSNNLFTGNWYASKKLAAPGSTLYNSTPDAAPNAQQFLSFTLPTYPANQMQHGWSRYGFSSTDDGVVRSLALIENDLQGLSTMRGVMVVTGAFSAGTFTWTTDSLVPNCVLDASGEKHLSSTVQMAWNESGTVGYAVMLGALSSASLSNRGYQPIIYKTTNSGASWAQVSGIDFNSPAMSPILDHISTTATNTNLAIPFVDDYDMTVDVNNRLHIGATLMSTFGHSSDSINFIGQFTHSDGEAYKWGHSPGNRPYLYDFIGDGTSPWTFVTVDSISTEGPSPSPTGDGFNDNPWDPTGTGGSKLSVDSRIQLGRTPDGHYVTFAWSESDTNFTNNARKWNSLPNIKARLMSIGSGTNMYQVSSTEQNVTQYPASQGTVNPDVSIRATLHYMSPTTSSATVLPSIPGCVVDLITPFTVTNSDPYSQLTNNTTWYTSAQLSYTFASCSGIPVGALEENQTGIEQSIIYPNPAKNSAVLSINIPEKTPLEIGIYNIVGQLQSQNTYPTVSGVNNIQLDLSALPQGVYLVKLKSGNASSNKKIIIE